MIRVYLYSDRYEGRSILAEGLLAVLRPAGRFEIVCLRSVLPELLARLEESPPDVLLVDLSPEAVAVTLREIRNAAPRCKTVLWVETISAELSFQAMSLGVRGVLRKSLPTDMLLNCLTNVHQGELWFEKALTDRMLAAKRVALSPREGQLVTLLSHGLKNKEIAATLRIGEGTVKVYLSRLFQKVGVQDRFELALFGVRNMAGTEMQGFVETEMMPVPSLRTVILDQPRQRVA